VRRSSRPPRPRVTLSEQGGVRYLHFGTAWVQGAMRISRPWQLELDYQQQMMALALLLPAPARVLQLGLGAAALTKFCYRQLPEAQLRVVELSAEVIDAARAWFGLPPDDARLEVVPADARTFLQTLRPAARADWLQVDLYDATARGPVHDDVEFYRLCRTALRRPGVACFNLFGSRFDPSCAAIGAAFDDRVLVGPPVDAGNRIVFAVTGPRIDEPLTTLARRAERLRLDWRLPAPAWLAGLIHENSLTSRLRL
jgi:spermidine synthase